MLALRAARSTLVREHLRRGEADWGRRGHKHKESIDRSTLLLWIISDSTIFRALLRAGFVLMRAPYPCRVTDSLEQAWRDSAKQLPDIDPEQGIALHRSWIRQAESSSAESARLQKDA